MAGVNWACHLHPKFKVSAKLRLLGIKLQSLGPLALSALAFSTVLKFLGYFLTPQLETLRMRTNIAGSFCGFLITSRIVVGSINQTLDESLEGRFLSGALVRRNGKAPKQ
ncbi:MAG: hypothetical protein LAO78_14660 [Acidobacteriia bacterium]|nr:hypothetical protein [Terriglobia bacterium]